MRFDFAKDFKTLAGDFQKVQKKWNPVGAKLNEYQLKRDDLLVREASRPFKGSKIGGWIHDEATANYNDTARSQGKRMEAGAIAALIYGGAAALGSAGGAGASAGGAAAGGGATAGGAAAGGGAASSSAAGGAGAASSSPSWMQWMQAGSNISRLAGGGGNSQPAEPPRMQAINYDAPQYKELLAQYNSNTGPFDDGHTIDIQGQTATLRNSNGQAVGSAPVNQDLFAAVEAMKQKQGVSDGTA